VAYTTKIAAIRRLTMTAPQKNSPTDLELRRLVIQVASGLQTDVMTHREAIEEITRIIKDREAALLSRIEAVDRIEVIDDTGRAYVKGGIYGTPVKVELSYQDDGKTLKVFVTELNKLRSDI
jgi:hypothetical protein